MLRQDTLNLNLDDLVEQAQNGNEDALDALIQCARPKVEQYLRKRVRSSADCDDLTQEVLIRIARALPSTQLEAPFEHWVMRITTNCLRTYYQRILPRREQFLEDFGENAHNLQQDRTETSLIERIAQEQVEEQLESIARQVCSDAERRVLLLHAQGETMEMVARMLDMNTNTVRSYLMRARAKVLAHIVQYQPELLGGREGIMQAIQRAQQQASPSEQLTEGEVRALVEMPARNQTLLRRACLKIARFLRVE